MSDTLRLAGLRSWRAMRRWNMCWRPAIGALDLAITPGVELADVVLWADGPTDAFDALLDAAAAGDLHMVVAVSTEALDQWSFAVGAPGVDLVPKADHEGPVRAIARAFARERGGARKRG